VEHRLGHRVEPLCWRPLVDVAGSPPKLRVQFLAAADKMEMDYEDVSNAVVWLASAESRCLTGVALTVSAEWMFRESMIQN
jgi:NAD(P)-dependent dehydrogenase (short-subunit alcohol dehydrogenase family)